MLDYRILTCAECGCAAGHITEPSRIGQSGGPVALCCKCWEASKDQRLTSRQAAFRDAAAAVRALAVSLASDRVIVEKSPPTHVKDDTKGPDFLVCYPWVCEAIETTAKKLAEQKRESGKAWMTPKCRTCGREIVHLRVDAATPWAKDDRYPLAECWRCFQSHPVESGLGPEQKLRPVVVCGSDCTWKVVGE